MALILYVEGGCVVVSDIKVKCDSYPCDWSREVVDIRDWHNIYCPKCLGSIIITDTDLRIYRRAVIWSMVSVFLNRVTFGWVKLCRVNIGTTGMK